MSRLFRRQVVEERADLTIEQVADWYRQLRISASPSGVFVDNDTAMRHDAVWSCVTRKSEDVSMFPVDVVRYTGGVRQDVSPAPQIITAPSVNVPAMDWRYQVMLSWLTAGNAWGLVTQTSGQYPSRIELVNQCRVMVEWMPNTVRYYVDSVHHDLWPVGDLWHVPAYTMPGCVVGLSPICYHAATIGNGLAAEQFSGQFFGAGGIPVSLLMPDRDPGEAGAAGLKAAFQAASLSRAPVVLPQSVKFEQISVNPEDSQFIETMKYTVEQVCRIFGEDPADHGSSGGGSSLTYANRSDADLARLKRRQFWVTKLQNALTDLLPRPQVVRLNTSAALMMTDKERQEVHGMRLAQKTTTINEVRKIEDEQPFPDPQYDEPGIPGAITSPAPSTTGGVE